MNNLISKIVGVCLGLSLATGVAVGVGAGNQEITRANADAQTVSWTATNQNNFGGTISSQNGTKTGTISTGSFSWNYTNTLTALASNKSDYLSFVGSTWIQLGSGNAAHSLELTTSNIPGTISAINLYAATNGTHKVTISVGNTKYVDNASLPTYSGNAAADNPALADAITTGTGSSSGNITISITPGTRKAFVIGKLEVTYDNGGTASTVQSVAISNGPSSTVTNINVGTAGPTLTATATMRSGTSVPTFTWASDNTDAVTVGETTGALTYVGNGTAHITATASLPAGNQSGDTNVGTLTIETSNLIGSSTNPFTVAQALAVVSSTGETATAYDCYTSGVVSRIKIDETFNSQYGNKIFWFSADGNQSNEIEAFHCLYLNGAKMTEAQFNSITAGDNVTVVGKLVNYQGNTPEYTSGCYLTAHTKPANQPQISITESSFTMNVGDTDVTLHETHSNVPTGGSIKWVSETPAVATIGESTGVVHALSAGSSVITAKIVDSSDQMVVSATITVTVTNISYPISDGDTFIIKYVGNQDTYYFTGVSNSIGTYSTTKSEAAVITAEEGETTQQFYLRFNDVYLEYHGNENKVFTSATKIDSALWTIVNDGTKLTIANVEISGRHFKFNTSSGSERFCCYTTDSNIDIEIVTAPEVDEVIVVGDASANAAGATSIAKEFEYEVIYVDSNNPGNSGVTVSVLNSNDAADGASVTAAPSNGSFVVTFTANDTFTITVTSKEDTSKSDSTTIVITGIFEPVPLGSYNYFKLSSGTTVESGIYVIAIDTGSSVYGMTRTVSNNKYAFSSALTIANNEKIGPSEGDALAFEITASNGEYTIKNLSTDLFVKSTGSSSTNVNEDASEHKWTINQGTNGSFRITSSTTNRPLIGRAGTYNVFGCYAASNASSGSTEYFDVELFKAFTAEEFAGHLINNVTCDANGSSAPTYVSSYSWSILSDEFTNKLTTSEQAKLRNAEYTITGSGSQTVVTPGSGTSQTIANAVSKYDYIVGKYGTTSYTNFIGRTVTPLSNVINPLNNVDNNAAIFALVAISMVTMTVVGAYFFLRKKKEVK